MNRLIVMTLTGSLALAGCASSNPPQSYDDLAQKIDSMKNDESVTRYAPVALKEAERQLEDTRQTWEEEGEGPAFSHEQYLTEKMVEIANQRAELKRMESQLDTASQRRKDLILSKRKQELEQARSEAQKFQSQLSDLESKFSQIQAEQTERGIILTLSDMLFEFGKAELQPGGERAIDELASFLNQNPKTRVTLEGYTDAIGDEAFNKELSRKRAEAVMAGLRQHNVSSSRIDVKAFGENYPVASNDTEAGRQQNRRVEVVLSQEGETYEAPSGDNQNM
ncbi:MAG: OmpA family protein [Pseudomonadota bacterium]|nr:hypothetical protein [Pseudomonadales bacterium]MDY6919141.1 OmpA family protein [Pseudomonadota bacterium]